jgi:hypothetical protein
MRTKTEYVVEKNDRGKDVPRKVGLAPVQREGMEYEFTVFFDLSSEHIASVSKDRTSLFDGQYFRPGRETGERLLEWLNAGTEVPPPQPSPSRQESTGLPKGNEPSEDDYGQDIPPLEPVSDAQLKKIHIGFNELDIVDREHRRNWIAAMLGRNSISSSKDLSGEDASLVIDALEQAIASRQKGAA